MGTPVADNSALGILVEDIVAEDIVGEHIAVAEVDTVAADNLLPFDQGCSWQNCWIMQDLWQAFAVEPNFAGKHLASGRYE